MRSALTAVLALTLALLTGTAHAAPGDLDSSYSGDGWRTIDFGGWQERGHAVAITPSGSILVAGRSSHNGALESSNFALARSSPDGGSVEGRITDFGGFEEANGVALQGFGGKIVASGFSFANGGSRKFATARYNPDLQPDPEFNLTGTGLTEFAGSDGVAFGVAVYPAPDYRIVEVGRAGNDFGLARHRASDGTLDPDFGGGKRTTDLGGIDHAHAVALDAFGRIVVAGLTGPPGDADFAVARYRGIDGSLDKPGFGPDGYRETDLGSAGDSANAVAIQPDGKIVLAGVTTATSSDFALARYNDDGSLDTTFSGDGKLTTDFAANHDIGTGVAVQPDGRIVVAGFSFSSTTNNDFAVARYNPDGSLDTSFSGDGKQMTDLGSNDIATSIALQPDGNIVLAGYSEPSQLTGNFAIARYQGGGVPPDSDGDGVADAADACPTVAAATANGCPVVVDPFPPPPGPQPKPPPPTSATSGPDLFTGLAGARNVFRAGAGNDRLTGGPLADLLCGEAGSDQIDGLAGADQLYGDFCPGAQLTALTRAAAAGEGNDSIRGGRGDDRIVGGGGNDKLTGDAGNDRVDGGAGRDTLSGGAGADRLSGGAGRNRYSGGAGNDKISAANGKKDRVDCGAGRRDSARVDRADRVKGCEKVRRRR